ncbi:MAG: hypothetical protein DRJ52_02800 [Thermoprotei archaeon]|nr:MAG: hypothetical protein DRJ52_02800 [Thermoprotei archaeon]RLF00184.1 MAG: hypothetical protein DRJ63_03155 [Thermoprotei archaeon]
MNRVRSLDDKELRRKVADMLADIAQELAYRNLNMSYDEALELVSHTRVFLKENTLIIEVSLRDTVLRYKIALHKT